MKVKDKVIVVTGAGGGVGRSLVLQLLAKGAEVAALDVNEVALSETKKAAPPDARLSLHTVDLTDKKAVFSLVDEVIREHRVIDGIINNAGIIQPFIPINELPLERAELVMNVNFYGTLYMVKAFLPELLTRPEAHITNVSSMGGFLPVPGQTAYGASKAAVKLLSEGLYTELMDTNVGVSVVFPGGIATDIMANSDVANTTGQTADSAKGMLLTPEKAASLIIRVTEKGKFRAFIGKDSKAMNFFYKRFPRLSMKLIRNMLGKMMK